MKWGELEKVSEQPRRFHEVWFATRRVFTSGRSQHTASDTAGATDKEITGLGLAGGGEAWSDSMGGGSLQTAYRRYSGFQAGAVRTRR
ncbi:MAG: hypothetical protein LBT40_18160 [Deltaproteobacteria bacterium]|jgi:hypothetical protein|nr:hypothetical protein [Deltaproteobacteria bacterium]